MLWLYGWTACLAAFAVALRFVPYSDRGDLDPLWSAVMGAIGLLVLAASVYVVYVLEILKFKRLDAVRLRRARPGATEAEIDADVEQRLETGEFEAVAAAGARGHNGRGQRFGYPYRSARTALIRSAATPSRRGRRARIR